MFAYFSPAKTRGTEPVPKEIYASHVEALFSDSKSFLIGVIAAFLTALVTGIEAHRPSIICIALALAAVGCLRLYSMNVFAGRRQGLDSAGLRRWEAWYVAGGSAHVLLLGLLCLFSFAWTDDAFARLASVSITMAYLVGTPGRSFASDLLVNAQILSAAVPMLIALALAGRFYWFIILFVMIPFFLAMKTISTRLRGIFLSAVYRARDLSFLANRFDTALNNMPQGLAMFEADGRITVSNQRLFDLLQVPPGSERCATIDALMQDCAKAGTVDEASASQIASDVAAGSKTPSDAGSVLLMEDGRSVSFTLQPMENGGGVVLLEDVTERLRAQASINYMAHYDALTGLPNRHFFREYVQGALAAEQGMPGALIFVDLDQFKQVNDTLGHVIGDKLLSSVSHRLRMVIGPAGMVARFGGDEFVVFQSLERIREDAAQLASLIIQQLSDAFDIEGNKIVVGASIGIAVSCESSANVDDLLRDADLALYRAKSEGRGTFRFFEGEMEVRARVRREIEKDLREALARDELELHYQPIYHIASKTFTVCEALIRWKHPQHGMIPPSDFIPIAEEMGLIWSIGQWVLRRACRECAGWPPGISVAVNISAMQFRRGNVVAAVRQALKEAGLRPSRLDIEITESALLHDLQATRVVLHQLRDMGVRISLDDFGTGYSSLSYLQALPFNKVKIDRSFLQGVDRDSRALILLRGITRLSVDLGMTVVMEGVETADQLALITTGVHVAEVQGYYFSRPLPPGQLRAFLGGQADSAVA